MGPKVVLSVFYEWANVFRWRERESVRMLIWVAEGSWMSCDEEGEEDSRTEPVLQQIKLSHSHDLHSNDRVKNHFRDKRFLQRWRESWVSIRMYVCAYVYEICRQKTMRNMFLSPSVKCPQSFAGTPEPVCHSWSPQMSVRQGDINIQIWIKGRWTTLYTYNTLAEHWFMD